jgi:succinate dehydrogenase / fumarate reductase cytochrome b subunit
MALAGLFLLTFLPLHLIINLMLLKSDPGPFNEAAHFMATFPLIKIFEVVLIASILIHISYGIYLQIYNWLARPVGYVSGNKAETSFFSRFMIWTGSTVLIFLMLHFFNFYFVKLGFVEGDPENFYLMAHNLFKIIISILPVSSFLASTSIMLFHRHFRHWGLITEYGHRL